MTAACAESPYAELHCISNFTFLRGASHPEELVERAGQLGYRALALTDECSVAGIVRAHVAARRLGVRLIVGSEFRLADGLRLVLLAASRRGYGQLCALITRGRCAAPKGAYRLTRDDFEAGAHTRSPAGLSDCLAIWLPGRTPDPAAARWLSSRFAGRCWIAVELSLDGDHRRRLAGLTSLSLAVDMPMVAASDVHMHVRGRRALQDTLTAIRLQTHVDRAGYRLQPN
ncbi:MAG: PHP domain-containing protein, partial [Gammaproteobacteria bacterium]